MKITFVVNTLGLTGGIKIILQLANGLSAVGHDVSVVHLLCLNYDSAGRLKAILKKLKYLLLGFVGKGGVSWFQVDKKIRISRIISLKGVEGDVIIATANETADWVNKLSPKAGEKFYFIQDYEIWTREASLVEATYKMPLKKIVISSWLKRLLEEKFNEKVYGVVTNGIETYENIFADRKKTPGIKRILMLYHILPKKGIKFGLEALEAIKSKHPEVDIVMFGAYQPVRPLPEYIKYHFRPDIGGKLRELYLSSDIYLMPSLQEGCVITPMEAMSYGCAVVATDVGGVKDYSVPGETALVVPPGDSNALVSALDDLLMDNGKLERIAKAGNEHIKKFTWDMAIRKLESILSDNK